MYLLLFQFNKNSKITLSVNKFSFSVALFYQVLYTSIQVQVENSTKVKEEDSMKRFIGIISIFVVALMVCVCLTPNTAMASFKKAAKDTGRAAVNYPANVVNESAQAVGRAVKGTADMVYNTGKAAGSSFVGKGNPKNIVTEAADGTGKTLKNATVETVEMPVQAGKKTAEQNR